MDVASTSRNPSNRAVTRLAASDISSFNHVVSLTLSSPPCEEFAVLELTIKDRFSFGPAATIISSVSELVIKLCMTVTYGSLLTTSIFLGPYLRIRQTSMALLKLSEVDKVANSDKNYMLKS